MMRQSDPARSYSVPTYSLATQLGLVNAYIHYILSLGLYPFPMKVRPSTLFTWVCVIRHGCPALRSMTRGALETDHGTVACTSPGPHIQKPRRADATSALSLLQHTGCSVHSFLYGLLATRHARRKTSRGAGKVL